MGGGSEVRKDLLVRRHPWGELWACTSPGGPRLVLFAGDADPALVERAAKAHEDIASPHIARVAEVSLVPRQVHIAFDCPAVVDLDLIIDAASASDIRLPFASAIAFNEFVIDALEAAHCAPGGPHCLGALGRRNVLVDRQGDVWLFGFGGNFPARHLDGAVHNVGGLSIAPEVAFGRAPDVVADVYVAFAFIVSLFPHVDMYPPYVAAIQGTAGGEGNEVPNALGRLSSSVLGVSAADRPVDIDSLRRAYRTVRSADPNMPERDDDGLRRHLADLVRSALDESPTPSSRRPNVVLTIQARARRIRVAGGAWIDLSKRHTLWRLLMALVEGHGHAPLTVAQMQSKGWPGEKILREAGRARVYVAVSTLRRLGLGDVLVREESGYLLEPSARLDVVR